jgi:GTP cyclohydrolase III
MTVKGIACNCNREISNFRTVKAFHGSVKIIHIDVEDGTHKITLSQTANKIQKYVR